MTIGFSRNSTAVRFPAVSETSCPSGWSETSARSDNLGAVIHDAWVMITPVQFLPLPVDKEVEAEAVSFVPLRRRRARYPLAELLANVTPENTHKETSWGKPVGKEVW